MDSYIFFTNWTAETFSHAWDKQMFTLNPGESRSLPDYLARHLAKHLANRELMKNADSKFGSYVNNFENPVFQEYFQKALSGETSPPVTPTSTANTSEPGSNIVPTNRFCDSCDSKGVRHKAVCPKFVKKNTAPKPAPAEEEFEGLNNK